MKKLFLVFAFAICFSKLLAQDVPAIEWEKSLGGSAFDGANSVVETTDGGFILAGVSLSEDGDVLGNHGSWDYWIVKLNATGNMEWQKCLGGSGDDEAYSIQQTNDGGFVVAGAGGSIDGDVEGNHGSWDYWIVRLDAQGNIKWQKNLGGTEDDIAYSIQQTTDGGFIVAGSSKSNDGDVFLNHGEWNNEDFWIVKLDSIGSIEWQESLGGTYYEVAYSVQQTFDGGYIIAGATTSNDGDVIGHYSEWDYWIVKLNYQGNIEWQKCLGGTDGDICRAVQQHIDGGFLVAGYSHSDDDDVNCGPSGDYWIVKLSTDGNIEWQKCLGALFQENSLSITSTTDGGFIFAGHATADGPNVTGNHGSFDYWIVKLDSIGNMEWQKSLGGSASDKATSIKQTTDGGFVVVGESTSSDGDVTGNHGSFDYWIVRLAGNQNNIADCSLFPNPADQLVNIHLQLENNNSLDAFINISNALGQIVFEKKSSFINGILYEQIPLDEKFSPGIYFVKVSSDQQQWSAPLVVEK